MKPPAPQSISLICTLGPSSFEPRIIRQLDEVGVDLFRINMSHTPAERLRGIIRSVRAHTRKPLCVDTEGAQVRTGPFVGGTVNLAAGDVVSLVPASRPGDAGTVPLNPPEVFSFLESGMLLSLDFNAVLLLVSGRKNGRWQARVLCGGAVGSNKGVSVDRHVPLNPMTRKDIRAISIARAEGIRHFAFSFASSAEAVRAVRKAAGPRSIIISKIESRKAICNAEEIFSASDAVLIDRGDMSRDVAIEHVPFMQKRLIRTAQRHSKPIYVATNLLESMMSTPLPTRAEVNDVVNTLIDGANGLVLAAETAIGKYPVRCARMVRRLVNEYVSETWRKGHTSSQWLGNGMLENRVSPHGGSLVSRIAEPGALPPRGIKSVSVGPSVVRDLQQIADGVYSPLTGFMTRDQIHSVLEEYRLPDGVPWSLPIVLPLPKDAVRFDLGDTILLTSTATGKPCARMRVRDIYPYDSAALCRAWFGTDDRRHPGVRRLRDSGDRIIGGEITLVHRTEFAPMEFSLTPAQTRAIFAHNGWDKVVGFHTRNAPHRAHEFIQLAAMERAGADAVLIHPALGRKKSGDFTPEAVLEAYRAHMTHLPPGRAVLSGFFSDSWYAGPREAVFTALCRKNFGCSHFIVGRDHTGVGNFYASDASHRLFDRMGDIGIEPIFFHQVGYSPRRRDYIESRGGNSELMTVSGTRVRELLNAGKTPPAWIMRSDVAKALLRLRGQGRNVFER